MSDFTKYSNYNKNSSFSSVVFGAQAPVLEVELNELQQLIDTKLGALHTVLGSGISFTDPTSDANIEIEGSSTNGFTINVYDGVAISKSHVIVFSNFSNVSPINANQYLYLKIKESVIDSTSQVKNEGNSTNVVYIQNTMKDARLGVETSRRKVVTFEVCVGNSVPTDSGDYEYVEILHLDSACNVSINYTGDQKLEEQMGGIKFSIEDGILCATYEE